MGLYMHLNTPNPRPGFARCGKRCRRFIVIERDQCILSYPIKSSVSAGFSVALEIHENVALCPSRCTLADQKQFAMEIGKRRKKFKSRPVTPRTLSNTHS